MSLHVVWRQILTQHNDFSTRSAIVVGFRYTSGFPRSSPYLWPMKAAYIKSDTRMMFGMKIYPNSPVLVMIALLF